ncbi:hypothetical protein F383_27277 [Gossypium arboreum]|uniref:Uncharacterized protein n=1 Tax=Gossypium arboreum TaxID=29729 RepID=A0A0B0P462_GOSAR|nr:hypothetical protein F383_27277 [Gossypium arboreum]
MPHYGLIPLLAYAMKCLFSILFLHHRLLIRCLRRPSHSPFCPLPFSHLKKEDGQSFTEVLACKQGKNRERTSKTGNVDELNRGYVDDMSELKQYGGYGRFLEQAFL